MSNKTNNIEEILRIERARANITIEEMCDKANIPRQSYYTMRSTGFKTLRASDLLALANLFNCSADYLLGRTNNPNHQITA